MHEREGRLEQRVLQVEVERAELRRRQHSLVDDRARAEARDDETGARFALDHAADDIELALEGVLVELGCGGDDCLADPGRDRGGRVAGDRRVERDLAPGDETLALFGDDALDELLLRVEEDADAVRAGRRQGFTELGAEERIGDLDEDAGAVARLGVRTGGAAVLEVREGGERADDRLVRAGGVEAGDEGDAAGVVLVRGVIEAPAHRVSALSGANRRWRRGVPTSVVAGARTQ